MTCQCGSINAVGCLEDHQKLILALPGAAGRPGEPGPPGADGEPGKDGVVDVAALERLDTPDLDTDLLVVDTDDNGVEVVKRTPWSAFKSRISTWLETVTATWQNKTLASANLTGVTQAGTILPTADNFGGGGAFYRMLTLKEPWGQNPGGTAFTDYSFAFATNITALGGYRALLSVGQRADGQGMLAPAGNAGLCIQVTDNARADRDVIIKPSGANGGLFIDGYVVTGNQSVDGKIWTRRDLLINGSAALTVDNVKTITNKTFVSPTLTGSPTVSGAPVVSLVAAPPATATSPGTLGQIAEDNNFVYVCVATNTWRRAPLSTW